MIKMLLKMTNNSSNNTKSKLKATTAKKQHKQINRNQK